MTVKLPNTYADLLHSNAARNLTNIVKFVYQNHCGNAFTDLRNSPRLIKTATDVSCSSHDFVGDMKYLNVYINKQNINAAQHVTLLNDKSDC